MSAGNEEGGRRGHLPELAVRRPVTTTMVFVALVALGAVAFSRLAVDLLPAVDFPRISVMTEYPGVGSGEIETLITRPIEEGLASIQGVEKIQAMSTEGRSRVTLEFTWGTSLDSALADVRANLERVRANLPEDALPPVAFKFDLSGFPVIFLSMQGEGLDQRRLRRIAEDRIKYRLERVDGVARTDIRGGLERQIHVNLRSDRIASLGLSPTRIVEILGLENRDVPGGQVDRGDRELILKTRGELTRLEDLGEIVIAHRPEGPVRLRDVAEIEDASEEATNTVRIGGEPGIRLAVSKLAGANTVDVAERVRAEMKRLEEDFPELRFGVLTDTSEFIRDAVSNVQQGALMGGLLAVLILFLFLRNVRATLVIATAIPISSIATFWLMDLGDITLNTISFGGLALGIGMLVDNAIVILENIYRRREEGDTDPRHAAIRGSAEVSQAVIASTLTTLSVFVPVVFLSGFPRIFFGQLAMVVSFALACSLFVALTFVPMLSSRFLGKARPAALSESGQGLFARAERIYERFVGWSLRHPIVVTLSALLLLAASIGAIGTGLVKTELMPESDQGEVDISIELPSGTRLEVTEGIIRDVEAIASQIPEAESIVAVAGPPGHWSGAGSNAGYVGIELVDDRSRTSAEVAAELRPLVSNIPDARVRVRPGGGLWIFNFLRGGGDRLQVNVSGHDLETAGRLAAEVSELMREVPGVADVRVSRLEGMGELAIQVDREKAAAMGLSTSSIGNTIRTYVLGTTATYLRELGDEYRVVVRLRNEDRRFLEQVLELPVFTPDGAQVPLRSVATVSEQEGPISIEREGQERVIHITGTLEETTSDLGSVASAVQARIRSQIVVPPGFEVHLSGESEQQAETFGSLLVGLLLAVALVYMVMASQFENMLQPFVIMFAVPFALVGVVATLVATGTSFNMNSFLGVIVLVGIVVNNAIVLVDYVNLLRREQGLPLREALLTGARKRLRPILMTTTTTVLALLPVAIGVGAGGELNAPLARVVAGGLAFSSLVTLIIVPLGYMALESRLEKRRKGRAERPPPLEVVTEMPGRDEGDTLARP